MEALACKEEAFKRKKVWLEGSYEPVLRIKKGTVEFVDRRDENACERCEGIAKQKGAESKGNGGKL